MRNHRNNRSSGLDKVWLSDGASNVVGQNIRRLRREQKLTQEQLVAKCQIRGLNLSRGTLAKIEARLRFVKACELYVIAKAMKVPMEAFYPPGFGRESSQDGASRSRGGRR